MRAGTDGTQIQLRTNIFPLRLPQQYCLYQYHVNFNPEVPSMAIRKAMIAEKKEHFGNYYMFDGMQLFLQARLDNDVSLSSIVNLPSCKLLIALAAFIAAPHTRAMFRCLLVCFTRVMSSLKIACSCKFL